MKKIRSKSKIERRLLGRIELRNGQYVFVPDRLLKPARKIEYVPYYASI